jgi:DNA-binding SARP family transcriptional activator
MAQAIGDARTGGLSVGFLGPLRVVRHGAPVVLGGRQQKAVLGVLVSEANSVVSVARLTEAVWGEQVGNRAVAAVQTYVSRLREVLETGSPARRRQPGAVDRAGRLPAAHSGQ